MKRIISVFAISLITFLVYAQTITISEENRRMDTYPFGDPDPVAKPGRIYPYFRFDGYTIDPVESDWKMIKLENEWIRLWITPEMGGKIYGAQDKTTDNYFIYFNNSVKFRDIAMRGAWTSGGIEINFGSIGHAPTTATPVDYYLRQNSDSSVSCFLGSYDLTSRTEWRVEVILWPDRSYFETRSSWINPTVMSSSLYHWLNASADTGEDLKYYFPGTNFIDHSGNASAWPLIGGRDISEYMANDYGNNHSYHVLGSYTDWFAGYYGKREFGFGHWSRYPLKQGKKIWLWALSREGGIWEGLLTDTLKGNRQYTEIQTGLLYNQAGAGSTFSPFKHMSFTPGSVQNFREIWFPFNSTSGVSSVSSDAIGNIIHRGDSLFICICPLVQKTDTLEILINGSVSQSIGFVMDPLQTEYFYAGTEDMNISARLKGAQLIIEEEVDLGELDRPMETMDFDWESTYGIYTMGLENFRQRDYVNSEKWLNRCIEIDPSFIPAYKLLSEVKFYKLQYDESRRLLNKVLSFDTYDPDANFLSGAIYEISQDLMKARDAYGIALKYEKYRNSTVGRLVAISLNENKLSEAGDYLKLYPGLKEHPEIARYNLIYLRKIGNDSLFLQKISEMIKVDPLNHFARFEKYMFTKDQTDSDELSRYIVNEFPFQTYIELATLYMNTGLYFEANELMGLSPENPLVSYYRAYLAWKLSDNDSSDKHLKEALEANIDFVFPFRSETEEILKWAEKQESHWKNRYYLSLIYMSRFRNEEALSLMNSAGEQPDDYFFYLARGDIKISSDSIAAERDYREALTRDKKQWRSYHRLVDFYNSLGFSSRAIELSSQAYDLDRTNYITAFDHAKTLLLRNRVYETIELLNQITILPHEGASQGREVWMRANILASLDKYSQNEIEDAKRFVDDAYRWPENLGVGKPYEVDERMIDFLNALILTKNNKFDEAKKIYKSIIAYTDNQNVGNRSLGILKVFSLRELNFTEEADKYFLSWRENIPEERVKNWAQALYDGNFAEAEVNAEKKVTKKQSEPWDPRPVWENISLLNNIVLLYLRERW